MGDVVRRKQKRQAEIVLTLILFIIPITVPQMGILWKCALWVIAWVLFLHFVQAQVRWLHAMWWPRRAFAAVLATVCLVALVYEPIYATWRAERAAETSGLLKAIPDGRDHSSENPQIQMGQGGTFFSLELLQNQAVNFMGLPQDTIRIKKSGGEVLLSTTVRDGAGNLVVEIVDNRWTVSPSKTNCWDKNYTQDSLEVKDGRGRVVLQVRMLPNTIQIQGEWPNLNAPGKPTVFYEDGQFNERDGITPRFKYPSDLYWGERVN